MKKIILRTLGVFVMIVVFLFVYLILFENRGKAVSEGKPIGKYDTPKAALLVIDIQESTTGTVSQYENLAKISAGLIGTINNVIDQAVKDSLPVIYIRSEITDPIINLINNSMAKGSVGAALDKRLKVVAGPVFTKDKEDSFCNPELDRFLTEGRISRLMIVGLDAAYCVNTTIKAAHNRGYEVVVITDAVFSSDEELRNQMFKEFAERKVKLIRTDEFIKNVD